MVEGAEDDVVRVLVELLDRVAMDVDDARLTHDVDEPGAPDFAGDHLRRQREVIEDGAQRPGRLGELALFIHDVALNGDDGPFHLHYALSSADVWERSWWTSACASFPSDLPC